MRCCCLPDGPLAADWQIELLAETVGHHVEARRLPLIQQRGVATVLVLLDERRSVIPAKLYRLARPAAVLPENPGHLRP